MIDQWIHLSRFPIGWMTRPESSRIQNGAGATARARRGDRLVDPSRNPRFGDGSIPTIHTIFRGMNIHLTAILGFTRGTRFWHTAIWQLTFVSNWTWNVPCTVFLPPILPASWPLIFFKPHSCCGTAPGQLCDVGAFQIHGRLSGAVWRHARGPVELMSTLWMTDFGERTSGLRTIATTQWIVQIIWIYTKNLNSISNKLWRNSTFSTR